MALADIAALSDPVNEEAFVNRSKSSLAMSALVVIAASWLLLYGYVGGEVANGGTVRGTIHLDGTPPRLPAHHATTSIPVCGESVPNEELTTGAGGALANVVVWIAGVERGAPAKARPLVLDQRQCRFIPHVATATVGSPFVLTSSDPTLHTTHARMGDRSLFNVALPVKGMRVTRRLDQAGVVRVACEAGHTWMRAYVHVFDHPYHAVTGANGRFELPSIPAGHYTLRAWHERLGEQTAQIEITAGGTASADLHFRAR